MPPRRASKPERGAVARATPKLSSRGRWRSRDSTRAGTRQPRASSACARTRWRARPRRGARRSASARSGTRRSASARPRPSNGKPGAALGARPRPAREKRAPSPSAARSSTSPPCRSRPRRGAGSRATPGLRAPWPARARSGGAAAEGSPRRKSRRGVHWPCKRQWTHAAARSRARGVSGARPAGTRGRRAARTRTRRRAAGPRLTRCTCPRWPCGTPTSTQRGGARSPRRASPCCTARTRCPWVRGTCATR
mmetsp:Transcript_10201/g.30213  ORF Transcript_10201/g.30213 Transcript_10201/m.30213 type:complete len:252 (-) Transcript_10201:231-986(-)